MAEDWLTTEEVSHKYGFKKAVLRKWSRARKIPAYKIEGEWKYKASEVEAWVESKKVS